MKTTENVQLDHEAHQAGSVKFPLCFLANDIDVPMNIGSFFRIADALGVEKIYLTGKSVTPPNQKIKKTSRSTEKYVEYAYEEDPIKVIEKLKDLGYKIISLEITSSSMDIDAWEFDGKQSVCLILGSENHGIAQDLLDHSDMTVHIPMLGVNSSMNVANACSIAAYEVVRRYKNGWQTKSRRAV